MILAKIRGHVMQALVFVLLLLATVVMGEPQ